MHSKTAISDLLEQVVGLCGQPIPPTSDEEALVERVNSLNATGAVLVDLVNVLLVGLTSNSHKAQKQCLERAREIATECDVDTRADPQPADDVEELQRQVYELREDWNRLKVQVRGRLGLGGDPTPLAPSPSDLRKLYQQLDRGRERDAGAHEDTH